MNGIRFADNKVVESDAPDADVSFAIHPTSLGDLSSDVKNPPLYWRRYYLPYLYVGAPKVKGFDSEPKLPMLTRAQVETWEDYANVVAPGRHFLARTKRNQFYLLKIVSSTGQGKARAYWKVTVAWRPVELKP